MKPASTMSMIFSCILAAAITLSLAGAVHGDSNDQSDSEACRLYSNLTPEQKLAVIQLFGEPCTGAGMVWLPECQSV